MDYKTKYGKYKKKYLELKEKLKNSENQSDVDSDEYFSEYNKKLKEEPLTLEFMNTRIHERYC